MFLLSKGLAMVFLFLKDLEQGVELQQRAHCRMIVEIRFTP